MTPALNFCFTSSIFRPSIVSAIRSASAHAPEAQVFVYCDSESIPRYRPLLPKATFEDILSFQARLGSSRPEIAARKMRALALVMNGGWYLDAFDTLTLRTLPAVQRFTIGEECWNPARHCTGACASPKDDPFAKAWLEAMNAVPDSSWNHWMDQTVCNRVIKSGRYSIDSLPTGRLNWPSESGFEGELRLSEEQIAWLQENAWVLHYFGRGLKGRAYKEMDLEQLRQCRDLNGWIPRKILHYFESTEALTPPRTGAR